MEDKETKFVNRIKERIGRSNKAAAELRRGDSKITEHMSWPHLFAVSYDLPSNEIEKNRIAYQTIAAAIARTKFTESVPEDQESEESGKKLGVVLAAIKQHEHVGDDESPLDIRLRRLIGCSSVKEVCRVLRPLLSLLRARGYGEKLDYVHLLYQLKWFDYPDSREKTKIEWVSDYYGGKKGASDE